MYQHHIETIERATAKLKKDPKVLAVILGGSVAHGFSSEASDIDLMLVLSEEDYRQTLITGDIHYTDKESAHYPQGYVEGKYISESFIKAVAQKGTEPARFAFKDAVLLYSRWDKIDDALISAAAAYPKEKKQENMQRFHAQLEGWKWMYFEGLKRNNIYVINYCVSNICLFAGRLILAYNELLYPYHKWFLRVLSSAEKKPENIVGLIEAALETKAEADVMALFDTVKSFHSWPEHQHGWVPQFVLDNELNWLDGPVPVADL